MKRRFVEEGFGGRRQARLRSGKKAKSIAQSECKNKEFKPEMNSDVPRMAHLCGLEGLGHRGKFKN